MLKLIAGLFFLALTATPQAEEPGVLGDWVEPAGSVIRIAPCGQELCARLIAISAQAPTRFDTNNPDEAKRKQPLCGLMIGHGFHLLDQNHADGGYLYDPKSGKTYHGSMARNGDRLELRGYVGIKLSGRTEVWSRPGNVSACTA